MMKKHFIFLITLILCLCGCNEQELVPTQASQPVPAKAEGEGGYLWLFMTNARYRKMFYAISRDCHDWTTLNLGRVVNSEFSGHHTYTKGRDGAWYGIGVEKVNSDNLVSLWRTEDFINWTISYFPVSVLDPDGWDTPRPALCAPKPYYDADSDQYIITWHPGHPYSDIPSRRTFYVLTSDFVTFTEPKLLFDWSEDYADLAMIDTFIRKMGDKYYAITKIESTREASPTLGKTIVWCESDNLTGPWTDPVRITPLDKQREAPILVDAPDGSLYLFAESFAESPYAYDMFAAPAMTGPWVEHSFKGPNVEDGTTRPGARHGWIVPVSESVYQGLIDKYLYEKMDIFASMSIAGVSGVDGSSLWASGSSDLRMLEIMDKSSVSNNLTAEASSVSDGGAKAAFSFTANRKVVPASRYDYWFCTPSSAVSSVNEEDGRIYISFPAAQTPLASGIDPSSTVKLVSDLGNTEAKSSFDKTLRHLSAYTTMSFTGLPVEATSVSIGVNGKSIAGRFSYPFDSDSGLQASTDALGTISLDLSNISVGSSFDVTYATAPFSVSAGDIMHLSFTTSEYSWVMDYVFPFAIDFTSGSLHTLTVDASTLSREEIAVNGVALMDEDLESGRYTDAGYLTSGKLSLTQGQTVTITGIADIDNLVPKEWLEPTGARGVYRFRAVDGDYVLFFNPDTRLMVMEIYDRTMRYPDALWQCGKYFAHAQYIYLNGGIPYPTANRMAFVDDSRVFFNDPAYYICMAKTSEYDSDNDGAVDAYVFESYFSCLSTATWMARFRLYYNVSITHIDMLGYSLTVDDGKAGFNDSKNPTQNNDAALRGTGTNSERVYHLVLDTGTKTITLALAN